MQFFPTDLSALILFLAAELPPPPRARLNEVNTHNGVLSQLAFGHKITLMRPVEFGEALAPGSRLTLVSNDKPDRFFTVIKFWMDKTSGVALALKTGVPIYQVGERGRQNLLLQLPIEEENEDRWCLLRPDQVDFDFVSGPITNMAFAVGQLAVFQGASDAHI
jgi:hypothetical protein